MMTILVIPLFIATVISTVEPVQPIAFISTTTGFGDTAVTDRSTVLTSTLREALDTTVKPCDDFEQYANGGWRQKQGKVKLDAFVDARQRSIEQVAKILEAARQQASTTTDPVIRAIGVFYASCLNAVAVVETAVKLPWGTRVESKSMKCWVDTEALLRPALSYAFVRDVMTPARVEYIEQLVTNLRSAIRAQVHGMSWIPDSVRTNMEHVLDTMQLQLQLYPDSVSYDDLSLDSLQYLENRSKLALRGGGGASQPYSINAAANPKALSVFVSTSFFQPPYFDLHAEPSANYSSLAYVLGHEIWHLLMPTFRWMDGGESRDRLSILVDSYLRIDNSDWVTVIEDFGDLGGLNAAYQAWKKSTAKSKLSVQEGFTPDQRFFLSYARVWRSTDRNFRSDLLHSSKLARVNGTLKNTPAFVKAFGCKEGDTMFLPINKRAHLF